MESLQAENKTIRRSILVLLIRIIFFYSILLLFSHKTFYIENVNSLYSLLSTIFFSRMTLIVLALTVATCMVCFISIIPSCLICMLIEKYVVKREVDPKWFLYIAVIISSAFFNYKFITHVELYLVFLIFLPFENIGINKHISKYRSVVGIWGIAILFIIGLIFVFRYLDGAAYKENVSKTYTVESISKVYICAGSKSKTFHRIKSCKGLSRCSGDIKQIDLNKAKKYGRRKCKICY